MNTFEGKTAIVTGAASGIGREIARQLAERGAIVLVTDLAGTALNTVAVEITRAGGRAEAMAVDVTSAEDLTTAVDHIVERHGTLDYLFNNAGVAIFGDFDVVTLADWDKIIDVNLRGVAYGSTIAYRRMVEQGHGHIVNTASVAGLVPVPLQAHYCATKHAVIGMSKTLGLEAEDHGVTVTAFCPAFVESGMFDNNTMRGELAGVDARAIVPIRPLATDRAVRRLLDGVSRKRRVVITPFYGKLGWWLERFSPTASHHLHRLSMRELRRRVARSAVGASKVNR